MMIHDQENYMRERAKNAVVIWLIWPQNCKPTTIARILLRSRACHDFSVKTTVAVIYLL